MTDPRSQLLLPLGPVQAVPTVQKTQSVLHGWHWLWMEANTPGVRCRISLAPRDPKFTVTALLTPLSFLHGSSMLMDAHGCGPVILNTHFVLEEAPCGQKEHRNEETQKGWQPRGRAEQKGMD
jgi:hypothetical protein